MIHGVWPEIAALVYFTTGGLLFAAAFRFMCALAEGAPKAVRLFTDLAVGLASGAIFLAATDGLFGGAITFPNVAVYVAASALWIEVLRLADIPSAKTVAAIKKPFMRKQENGVPKTNFRNAVKAFFKKRFTTSRADNASRTRRDRRLWFLRDSSRRRGRSGS